MAYCTQCGKLLATGAKFCGECFAPAVQTTPTLTNEVSGAASLKSSARGTPSRHTEAESVKDWPIWLPILLLLGFWFAEIALGRYALSEWAIANALGVALVYVALGYILAFVIAKIGRRKLTTSRAASACIVIFALGLIGHFSYETAPIESMPALQVERLPAPANINSPGSIDAPVENSSCQSSINSFTDEALKQVQKAAINGDATAQVRLARAYYEGVGFAKNYTLASCWYRQAAGRGDPWAQLFLGSMYENGEGAPQNNALAAESYRKAAEQGNALAQISLGWMYQDGKGGLPADDTLAALLSRKAAEQGNADAQFAQGGRYMLGRGVAKDEAQAIAWFRLAAAQGKADAQEALRLLTAEPGAQTDQRATAGTLPEQLTQKSGANISVDFQDVAIRGEFQIIGEFAGKRVVIDPSINGTATFRYVNTPWDQVLKEVSARQGLAVSITNDTIYVRKAEYTPAP